jgi:molecular chaperone HscC
MGIEISQNMGRDSYESGYYLPIIERNTSIPVSRVKNICTLRDNQSQSNIEIYQGESFLVKNNIRLGDFTIDVPRGPAEKETAGIRFTTI